MSIAATAFVSRQYRRERAALGQLHYERGRGLQQHNELNDAIEEYRKALIFSPDAPEYRLSFASALVEDGRLDEAQTHIEQLLEEDPTNGILNLMLGRIAQRRGETAKAIEYYQRAVYEYWPPDRVTDRRQARLELIDLLSRTGRREELIGELMTLYANFPSDQALRTSIGFELLDHGATSEATQVFREATRIAPKNSDAHRGLAQAYFSSGDYVSARHEFERAIRLNPRDKVSEEELKLTNEVVDLDPELIGVREAERLRRAQNLLRKTMSDVKACAAEAEASEEMAKANVLLAEKPEQSDDLPLDLQKEAVALWSQRPKWCEGKPTSDGALATILARLAGE